MTLSIVEYADGGISWRVVRATNFKHNAFTDRWSYDVVEVVRSGMLVTRLECISIVKKIVDSDEAIKYDDTYAIAAALGVTL